jgi:hypothetical protein
VRRQKAVPRTTKTHLRECWATPALPFWQDRIYVSTDTTFDGNDWNTDVQMNSLLLSLKRSDSSAELFLSLKYNGFEGTGSCFLDVTDFLERAQRFALFPLPNDGSVCVEGGYFNEGMRGLKQTHLHISARPMDGLGNLALEIEVAVPVEMGMNGFQAKLTCAIPTTYEQLKQLSEAMIALGKNYGDEYRLDL